MRRHSSGPSISGMYQSEITMGMRASWSSSQASRPLKALLTSYPAAFASAPSWALDTASSSTTSTGIGLAILPAFHRRPKVIEGGLRLPLQRLGLGVAGGCGEGIQALRHGRHEGLEDPVHRLGCPRLFHAPPEGREVDGR